MLLREGRPNFLLQPDCVLLRRSQQEVKGTLRPLWLSLCLRYLPPLFLLFPPVPCGPPMPHLSNSDGQPISLRPTRVHDCPGRRSARNGLSCASGDLEDVAVFLTFRALQ